MLRNFLNQGSAAATYGNLLTLPMGSGLLYVLPVYAQRSGSTGSYPALTYVIVRFGQSVGIGKTLQEALDKAFQGDAGANTGEGPTTPPSTPTSPTTPTTPTTPTDAKQAAAALMQQAQDAFTAADKALSSGDLGEYQKQVQVARAALREALAKLNG